MHLDYSLSLRWACALSTAIVLILLPGAEELPAQAIGQNGMVATSQPLASQAGLRILQQGGNAADAAIASAAVIAVTNPFMAGLGGVGGYALVYDAKSGEEITRSVLTQIIFEHENKEGPNLLPVTVLRQLIRFYGDSMQALVPSYLEFSMNSLSQEQQKLREQMQRLNN